MEKKIGRKTKVLSLLLTSMLVMSAAALMLISVGNAANGGPYIEVQPDSQSVDPGDPFSVDIHVDSDTYNLKAVNFYVLYDSSTFSVDSWTYTNLLGPSVLAIPIDDPGNFSYSIVRTDGSEVPVGDSLLTIDFSVDAGASGGSYPLDLHDDLRDENNNPIPSISVYDVNVVVAGGHLQVDAGGPYSGIVNSSITFYASASGGTPPYSYEWDFDYDGIFTADGKGESISNAYGTAGEYMIALRVVDDMSKEDIDITTVEIRDVPSAYRILPSSIYPGGNCAVIFNISNYGASGETTERFPDGFFYINSSLTGSFLLENNTVRFILSGERIFTYYLEALAPPGVYNFHGTLKDENGEEFIIKGDYNITVEEYPLTVDIDDHYRGQINQDIYFSPFIIGGFPPYVVQWDLNNDGIYETMGKNISYFWDDTGNYTVGLKVVDDANTTVTVALSVTVYEKQKIKNTTWLLILVLIVCCVLILLFLKYRHR